MAKEYKTYSEKLQHPRWQKRRLEILSRDNFCCQNCGETEKTLHVHHLDYVTGVEPWDYPDYYLSTLCFECHEKETNERPKLEKEIVRSFRLRFKDPFIQECLSEIMGRLPNVEYFFFLVWELQNHGIDTSDCLQKVVEENEQEIKYRKENIRQMCMAVGITNADTQRMYL